MSKKRVLHVIGAMNRAGAESMLMSLYRTIDRDEIQFDFLEFSFGESDYSAEIENLGGRIIHCKWESSPLAAISNFRRITKVIQDNGPYAAVHSHLLFASGIVLAAAAASSIPARIAHSHNSSADKHGIVESLYQGGSKFLIRTFASDIVACNRISGEFLFGKRKFQNRGIIIPNAVDLGIFRPLPKGSISPLRTKLGLSSDALSIVSVARLEAVKNHTFLIDMARELVRLNVNFELIFVGDGSLRNQLEEEAVNKGVQDNVKFWGLRSDIAEILQCVDLFVMPSHFEGMPVALIEAQAVGLPCLVSDRISSEIDLGLGLVEFAGLDDPQEWAKTVAKKRFPSPGADKIYSIFEKKGLTLEAGVEKCKNLYKR